MNIRCCEYKVLHFQLSDGNPFGFCVCRHWHSCSSNPERADQDLDQDHPVWIQAIQLSSSPTPRPRLRSIRSRPPNWSSLDLGYKAVASNLVPEKVFDMNFKRGTPTNACEAWFGRNVRGEHVREI